MSRLLCLVRWHHWVDYIWGGDPRMRLASRECSRCRRFEVYAYWSYHKANRANHEPLVLAGEQRIWSGRTVPVEERRARREP